MGTKAGRFTFLIYPSVYLFDIRFVFLLASIAPSKKKEIADGAFRAMIAGTVACFMTACVAGTVLGFGVPYSQ